MHIHVCTHGSAGRSGNSGYAFDVVEMLGPASVEILRTYLEKASKDGFDKLAKSALEVAQTLDSPSPRST